MPAAATDLIQQVLRAAAQTEQDSEASSGTVMMVVANVQMVFGMMGAMTSRMADVNTRLIDSRHCVSSAAAQAKRTAESMARLDGAVEKIATTAAAIDEIAQMTSLLAINAAIEAARAGEFGAGFAAVAAEVRSLSQKTARLTRDIGDHLQQIRQADAEVGETVEVVNNEFAQIETLFSELTDTVEDQTNSLATVATFAKEATESVTTLATTLDQMTALARQTADQCRQYETEEKELNPECP
jgi:methyl-accepting chemotaxis protein